MREYTKYIGLDVHKDALGVFRYCRISKRSNRSPWRSCSA